MRYSGIASVVERSRRDCFFSGGRRHTFYWRDRSTDVCSSHLNVVATLCCAVLLTNGAAKGRYRIAIEGIPRWGFRISRADVADFMIRQLTTDEFVRKMPATAY